MMDDKKLWMVLRKSFIQLAAESSTLAEKRAYLRMVAEIEHALGIEKPPAGNERAA